MSSTHVVDAVIKKSEIPPRYQ